MLVTLTVATAPINKYSTLHVLLISVLIARFTHVCFILVMVAWQRPEKQWYSALLDKLLSLLYLHNKYCLYHISFILLCCLYLQKYIK